MLVTSVESSTIKQVAWHNATLYLMFNKGTVYRYLRVPFIVYHNMINAPSIGKFFHASIKPTFPCQQFSGETLGSLDQLGDSVANPDMWNDTTFAGVV